MADEFISIANTIMSDIYKTKYLDLMAAPINRRRPLKSMVRHDTKATGNVQAHGALFSDVGGFSSGSFGDAGSYKAKQTNYTLKNQYFRARVDRKSIMLSKDPTGAFKEQLNMAMAGGKETIDRNLERMLVQGDGTGALGTIDTGGVTDNGDGTFDLVISAATWVRNNFRIEDLLNVSTNASVYEVVSVARGTRTVVIKRISGSDTPAAAEIVYRQKSKDAEMQGLRGVVKASSGSLYGITVGDGWQSQHLNAASKPLTEGMIVEMLYSIQDECGEFPDTMIVSHTQRKKLAELARDKALHIVDREVKKGEVLIGVFPHIVVEGVEIKIIASQDMVASEVFFVNMAKVSLRTAGKGEFIAGTDGILHYEGAALGNDVYSILWAQYGEIFIHPAFHGEINSLSTTVEVS